jgi:hypothetical protein
MELLDIRKWVLDYLQLQVDLPMDATDECAGPQSSHFSFIRDQHCLKYWQTGLQDLNDIILVSNNLQNMNGSQSGSHIRYGEYTQLLALINSQIRKRYGVSFANPYRIVNELFRPKLVI